MKITANYKKPDPPPVESFTIELSVDQLRYIKYLAYFANPERIRAEAAESLYNRLNDIPELSVPANYDVRFWCAS